MAGAPKLISAVDYHTAKEPFRIVLGDVRALRGANILDKRDGAMAWLDETRAMVTGYGGRPCRRTQRRRLRRRP